MSDDMHRCEWSDWQPRSDEVGGGYPWRECLECGRIEIDSSEEEADDSAA